MKLNRRLTIRVIATAALIAVVVLTLLIITSTPVQIAYHRWRMERAWNEIFATPSPSEWGAVEYTLGESYDAYVLHRQRLVELGAVCELHYELENVLLRTDVGRHFSKLLLSPGHPPCIDFESPFPSSPEPMRLTVWCYPEDAAAWTAFVADHDASDYRERFMSDTAGTDVD